MPRGGTCGFCALPEPVRSEAIAKWMAGAGSVTLFRWLAQKGVPVSQPIIENCLQRSLHHGPRPAARTEKTPAAQLGKLVDLLERSGIDPNDIGEVKTVRLSSWEGLTKNADGEAEVHKLEGASIVLAPEWAQGPRWEQIDRGKPVVVRPHKAPAKPSGDYKTAVVLPDTQIGHWRDISTGVLTPFHDEKAIGIALELIRQLQPDLVVLLGDYLDFAPLSDKFMREAGFALTIQPALDYGVELLGKIRALVPEAKIVLIEGNHDRRLQKAILNNNLDCFGVRRGGDPPGSWPVFSVPYLLRLDELDVEYVGGYPAGEYWINHNLVCIHGRIVRGGTQSTAAAVVDDERVSVIFGHVHRIEVKHKQRRVRGGAKQAQAVSPGCLCRTDGTVPSSKGATDPFGKPVPTVENWQQGLAVVTYEPDDGPFSIEIVPLYPERTTFFRGREVAHAG